MERILRPDSKGRITLGKMAKGVSSFVVTETEDHKIILEPKVEIYLHEQWLLNNKLALEQVMTGINDAKAGRVSDKGSFSKYIDEED